MKVLLIEASPEVRDLMRLVLIRASVQVVIATHGREGITKARQEMPDVITLDLELPDMNGLDVCCELKADPVAHRIPIIVISAVPDYDRQVASYAAGACEYLTKPFSILSFISLVLQKGSKD